jgi:hypothetical protein
LGDAIDFRLRIAIAVRATVKRLEMEGLVAARRDYTKGANRKRR